APPIINGVVLIKNGRVAKVGEKHRVKIPDKTTVIDCTGLTLVAGFWNSHVHFTESKWENAARLPAAQLNQQLRDTFTRYGFTTVFDLGSQVENTQVIRNRIESGEVDGLKILTTGTGLVPEGGTPFYVKPLKFPEILNPQQAASLVREKVKKRVDAVKIFTGPTPVEGGSPLIMRLELVRAITSEAHRHGKLVFSHPENDAGVNVAVDGGADILAHTAPTGSKWDQTQITKMKRAKITLIPTLSLFTKLGRSLGLPATTIENFISTPLEQLRAYSEVGGQIVFGTDLGFIADYDPTEEYLLMMRANMNFRQILASLTTNPAERFGVSNRTGRIAPGMDADIVIIAGDPEADIKALSNVKYTLRKGRIIYQ
ncbi:MAG TPA: amidohydrolase family protein, partial [Pyrinomonadaceae bacterium]|nr:amidohydrolase family protein [Pyrinomonadaceae bacterium]